ncbi:MAG: ThuA domain-containing protein [Bacteroidota bacterium]
MNSIIHFPKPIRQSQTILFLLCLVLFASCSKTEKKVLIFSKTAEFRHASIEAGVQSIRQLMESEGIQVTATEEAVYFTEDSLRQYAAVIFLNTTGDVLNNIQQADFERYIQAGGGFVGIHAATDTEYHWAWYNQLVGAYFDGHPAIQDAKLSCTSKGEVCCKGLPEVWSFNEEWYNFRSINPNIEVLVAVDESSYEGGTNGKNHPVVWKHQFDGGRAFYTALGHKEETYQDPLFLKQIGAGIEYAIGPNSLDYTKASTLRIPEENRFNKRVLDFNLDEPMELDELASRGIIYIERRGVIKLFDYATERVTILDTLDVHYDNEDGLLGIAVDPNYQDNSWIYLFYSPNITEATQHISRFTLKEDKLSDEKILFKIPLVRECCHSGGSLEFGPDGLLYIGVGDNTNPFESSGFAPIDERPNREHFDAQGTAANTNDLRGKILRIQPTEDGSYTIPAGNLFPEGTANCRPEIYVMGCRNPFRLSIDAKTKYLYWGDVGPDAGLADSLRGPVGMGEFNQARAAGFYGWPYSRGNNQMYTDYDFAREKSGAVFDPENIVNNSPNNTGIQKLPAIKESMIWYSYEKSEEFPWLGLGGVNPMSGPIYHKEDYPASEHAFPDYFDGKWLVYEWMRDWIYVVHLDKDQQMIQADPFLPNTEFSHPMDMLFSKDGKLYVLEYGQKWNSRNLDARLSVITYNPGNRPPLAQFEVDKEVGSAPLAVNFSAAKSMDYDQDRISYTWSLDGKLIIEKNVPDFDYVFENPGIYDVELTVKDHEGESASTNKKIMVGNEPPKISIDLSSDNTIYWTNKKVNYQVKVMDKEDGNSADGTVDISKVKITFDYIPQGEDLILASVGHQQNVSPRGLQLINASDCSACHHKDKKVAGPSYSAIAQRYDKKDKETLIHRIITGSQGIWGEQMMAPHPQLSVEEVDEIVSYILSLNPEKKTKEQLLPLAGSLEFNQHLKDEEAGKYVLIASYLDDGHPDVEGSALSVIEEFTFIPPKIELEHAVDLDKALGVWETQGRKVVGSIRAGKQIKINPIDFDNLGSISIGAAFNKEYAYQGIVEVRKGQSTGELLGSKTIEYFDKDKEAFKVFETAINPAQGLDTLFLVFKNAANEGQYIMNGDWIQLNYYE